MKPGDFIEWTYKYYNTLVSQDETLWSTLECCPVPIGAAALLVWITDKEYAWLTPGCSTHAGMIRGRPSVRSVGSGLFHAHAGGGQERHGMCGCSTHAGMIRLRKRVAVGGVRLFHARRDDTDSDCGRAFAKSVVPAAHSR